MSVIQWYPGHMTKAIRLISQSVALVDAVVYMLDARAPYSSLNPDFESITQSKPALMLLAKSDLADPAQTAEWQTWLRGKGWEAEPVVSHSHGAGKLVSRSIKKLLREKTERFKSRGANAVLRAMVIGIPNCGKSTLLNSVAGKKRAITGDRPGVTRGGQWLRTDDGIELLDTPGTLWNAFPDRRVGLNLAAVGSIKDDVLDLADIGAELLTLLVKLYPQQIFERYGKLDGGTPAELLEQLSLARGFILRGGAPDYERAGKAVLEDFRKGRTGRITLERVSDYK